MTLNVYKWISLPKTARFIFKIHFAAIILFANLSARAGYDTRSIFKRSLTGLNSEFSFSYTSCFTKAKEPSLSYYLPITGGRIIGFIPFLRVLVLCEMQSFSSRIWTRVAVSISYDHNITPRAPPYIAAIMNRKCLRKDHKKTNKFCDYFTHSFLKCLPLNKCAGWTF